MVSAVFRLLLPCLLLLCGGCGTGFSAPEDEPNDPFANPGGGGLFGAGDDDDATEDGETLPTPQGAYEGESVGELAGETCEGFAWIFVGSDGALDGNLSCAADDVVCDITLDELDLDEAGEAEAELDSCQGQVTLRLSAWDGELSGSIVSDLLSIEFIANHTPEEGD